MMMAGLNIRETQTQLVPFPITNWATIHETPYVPLQYLHYLLQASGVPETDIVSLFYSKADHSPGKQNRTFVGQKKILERRALLQERPTIIFATAMALQQFLQHFPTSAAWKHLPDACLGFVMEAVLPLTTPTPTPTGYPVSLTDFSRHHHDTPLNILQPRPTEPTILQNPAPLFAPQICFLMAAQLLQMARRQMGESEFQQTYGEFTNHLLPQPPSTAFSGLTHMDVDTYTTDPAHDHTDAQLKRPRAQETPPDSSVSSITTSSKDQTTEN